ncbi:hypothetical protein D3C80_1083290 [compost metagenome]
MEGAHQLAGLNLAEVELPQGKHLQQAADEVLARFAGEGHHGHGVQLVAQVMAQQQDTQHQRGGLAGTGTGDHAGRRRVAEDHLPLRRAWLGMGRQALGDVGLETLFKLGAQRQAPVVEQGVVQPGNAVAVGASVADHQDLAPGFVAVYPPFFVAFAQAIGVTGALTAGMALEPGIAMLRLQAAQAAPEQASGEATQPRQLRRRNQLQG